MENPTCRQYNLYMHEEDTFPCRRYIVKYDDKGIAEEAFSIKRNNTEDFPEFFDDRIFKLDKATALTGNNGYIDAYSEESFLKRAEKMRKKAKTTAFPVAGQQDGNLLPAQETERNADEVPAKQLAANAKNAALKKFWHNLKARF